MSEITVTKEKSLARQQTAPGLWNEFLTPAFRFGSLFRPSPFGLMRELSEEMDRAFRGLAPTSDGGAWAPAVDIQQCNGSLVVTAELPGLKKEEVKVELTDEALIIEGERKREHKEDHEGFHRWERSYGQFYRSIPLPEGAKTDQAKAELADGILKISLPVAEMKKKIREVTVEEAGKTKAA
jgi:HSP20 family protein